MAGPPAGSTSRRQTMLICSTSSAWGRRATRFRPGSRRSLGDSWPRLGGAQRLRRVGDAGRLDADLPKLPERRGNGAAEEKPRLRRPSAADERRSGRAQRGLRVRQWRAQGRAEAGRENDRVEALRRRLLEVDGLAGEASNIAPQLDSSVAYRVERADVDKRQ